MQRSSGLQLMHNALIDPRDLNKKKRKKEIYIFTASECIVHQLKSRDATKFWEDFGGGLNIDSLFSPPPKSSQNFVASLELMHNAFRCCEDVDFFSFFNQIPWVYECPRPL